MILIIDNYDSFVYTLAGYVKRLGENVIVERNDKITLEEIRLLSPQAIIISPGPCAPQDSGICIDLIKEFGAHIPILGVCLGHQAIGEAYGGRTIKAAVPVHGKVSMVEHDNSVLFHGIQSPLKTGRYHSLICDLANGTDLRITALSHKDEIMAVQHTHHPVFGVQFHPESVMTPCGMDLLNNFLSFAHEWNSQHKKDKQNIEF